MRASQPNEEMFLHETNSVAMNASQKTIVVDAPVGKVYEQWSRIEDLPKFITPLRDVRRIDDARFSYTWHPNGSDQQGVFHIVLQIPGRRIAWRTLSNGFMSGVVSFEPRSEQETEVTLKIRSIFDPPSLSRRVEEYLRNFKRLVEHERDSATD
ncbi:MAG: hypothetical protein DME54_15110 [Verrucomicrobia bacterium]|nr:MAG: hypothetical protein DME62_10435 [Verrucomicrobiota bacterium]PYK32751.1 MAG: hypothetical protein DME54_15110 [Verrucomicrobiota bacterium]PYL21062.1 MAG: hypothetical protein DMF41_03875 [Verrucomicrobiota bacterium]PYL80693.1 MAG: hypothetical protein DMF21_07940 [Verrucomicrobiota bacterium]